MRSGWRSSWLRDRHAADRVARWAPSASHTAQLAAQLAATASRPTRPDWHVLPAAVRDLDPHGVRAVVGYGSWYTDRLRKDTSFPDLYLVVDDYAHFHTRRFHAWMNRVLPPNVYFLWTEGDGHREIRGKYNVISVADVERECGPDLRDVYNAGRLTKVVWIAWVQDGATRSWLLDQLIHAHRTLTPPALALLPAHFTVDAFSLELLALSYRGEARLEGWDRIRALHAVHHPHYRALHTVLLEAFADATGLLEATADGWRRCPDPLWDALGDHAERLVRRSRRRGYLRWPRIVLTEPNLIDLAVNEAERKVGVRIDVTPRLRRHPLLYGLPAFLRVLRERNRLDRIG